MDPTHATTARSIRRPIMAIGGGAFSLDSGRGPLEAHWLALARAVRDRARPRLAFIGTATGDTDIAIGRFHDTFGDVGDTSHLGLFDRTIVDIEAYLLDQDAVYVGGGNTASLLAVWRAHGVDGALRSAHEAGVVLAGRSAGSICWFEGGTTDSFGPTLQPLTGALGFIPGSNCPHYDGEVQRRPLYHDLVGRGVLAEGIAVDDHAAAIYDGPEFIEVVAALAGPTAYRVRRGPGGVIETALPARVLAAGAGG